MPQLKSLAADATVYTVLETPTWINGVWECGDQRFVDPIKTLYAPVNTTVVMKAVLWYNCFTASEAIAIKASSDANVKEFYFRLQQLISEGETVDTSLTSVQEGVNYLSSISIITAARIPQILQGILQ